jgi:hypothetical protein
MAGSDPTEALLTAVQAETNCSESLNGEEARRHVIAAGNLCLLGIHATEEFQRKSFLKMAADALEPIAGDSDASPATRAKAQEIIDTANEKLQSLDH